MSRESLCQRFLWFVFALFEASLKQRLAQGCVQRQGACTSFPDYIAAKTSLRPFAFIVSSTYLGFFHCANFAFTLYAVTRSISEELFGDLLQSIAGCEVCDKV